MYQLEVATPMGSLLTKPENLGDIENFLSTVSTSSDITITLEDGTLAFMTSGMINSSVFFVKPVA